MGDVVDRVRKELRIVVRIPGVELDQERKIIKVPMLHQGRSPVQFLMRHGYKVITI
jgi:hypothetical protein